MLFTHKNTVWLLILLIAWSTRCQAQHQPLIANVFEIPAGWVKVAFEKNDVVDKGGDIVDEMVGYYVKEGQLKIPNDIVWIKPLYGDENILFFKNDRKIGEKLVTKAKNNESLTAEYIIGEETFSGLRWQFYEVITPGFSEPCREDFQQRIYVASYNGKEWVLSYYGAKSEKYNNLFPQILENISTNLLEK